MQLNERANYYKAVRFDHPEWIPTQMCINRACWDSYPPEELQEIQANHPRLFPQGATPMPPPMPPPGSRAGEPFTDPWGCVWETSIHGIRGAVVKHPLDSWDKFETYQAPDPETTTGDFPIDWKQLAERMQSNRARGKLAANGLRHGHTFMCLSYIRGYENLMFDMADEEPNLWKLITMLEEFNFSLVQRYLALGLDVMKYPEDLGMQKGPMLSPAMFRKYIKPSYQRLMAPAKASDCLVHMHSDGDIRTLIDDLIDSGVDILNLQDLVNGIDWIRQNLAGKLCIELDIDRQKVTRFGSPAEIDALIRTEVEQLGSCEGGLLLLYDLYPGIPLENIRAVADALERYMGYHTED